MKRSKSMAFLFGMLFTCGWLFSVETKCFGADLFVASHENHRVLRFDGDTGAFVGEFVSGVSNLKPRGLIFNSRGNLLVASPGVIYEFDGEDGSLLRVFASNAALNESNLFAFGPDGDLFVTNVPSGDPGPAHHISRFDGTTGAYKGIFATTDLWNPQAMLFLPDGTLLVANSLANNILRFNEKGELIGQFVKSGAGGLDDPCGMVFGHNRNIFVASLQNDKILEFDSNTGKFRRVFASGKGLSRPRSIVFGPNGNLFVTNDGTASVSEFDSKTGKFLGIFASSDGLISTYDLVFKPTNNQPDNLEVPLDRIAVPDKDSFEATAKLVEEVFSKEFDSATSIAQKVALAKLVLDNGVKTEDDVTGRYVLLRMAATLAAENGDTDTSLKAIELAERGYEIDGLAAKAEVLAALAKSIRGQNQQKALANSINDVISAARTVDRYDLAVDLSELGLESTRKARDIAATKEAVACLTEVKLLRDEFAAIQPARAELELKPADPAANLAVGSFYCFTKGDWDTGSPMLALGNNGALKDLAAREIADPDQSGDQMKLGDEWWEMASKESGRKRQQMEDRARYWYRLALPGLTGLSRARVQKRL